MRPPAVRARSVPLHRFHHEQRLLCLDLIAHRDIDRHDTSRHRCAHAIAGGIRGAFETEGARRMERSRRPRSCTTRSSPERSRDTRCGRPSSSSVSENAECDRRFTACRWPSCTKVKSAALPVTSSSRRRPRHSSQTGRALAWPTRQPSAIAQGEYLSWPRDAPVRASSISSCRRAHTAAASAGIDTWVGVSSYSPR